MLPPMTRNVHSPHASFSKTPGNARQISRNRLIAGFESSYMRGCAIGCFAHLLLGGNQPRVARGTHAPDAIRPGAIARDNICRPQHVVLVNAGSWRYRQHREREERWLPFSMVYRIGGDMDVRRRVIRQYRIATVGVADAARKIAARDVHFQAAPGRKSMVDVSKMNRYLVDLIRL